MKIVGCLESFLLGCKNSLYSGNIYNLRSGIELMIGGTTKTGYFCVQSEHFQDKYFSKLWTTKK